MHRSTDPAAVARDPLWLPHRYDPTRDAFHFVHATRADHRGATFLTDEHLANHDKPVVVGRVSATAAAPPAAPLHFILHSAYCCSTMLARALDIETVAMSLKEPVVLNDLSGWRHRDGAPRDIARVLDDTLRLLGRPFGAGEAIIVKPSNLINVFAPAMLAMRPAARALLLYAPLPTYLGSIAKKGMWGRLWVRDLLIKLLKDGLVDLGFSQQDYLGHTDLQAAAVGWLAQHALFARTVEQFGPARVRTLDSETLVAHPHAALAALAALFDLGLDDAGVAAVVDGPAFRRHSKLGTDFTGEARSIEQRDAAAVHGDEIEKVVAWAMAVAENAGVSLTLDAALID